MLIRIIPLLIVVVAIWYGVNWFIRTPPAQARQTLGKVALYGGIGVLLLLVLTGRLSWVFAAAAAAVPVLQRGFGLLRLVPLIKPLLDAIGIAKAAHRSGGGSAGGKQSRVETAWLRMTLDHDSGAMDGIVLQGPQQGLKLAELSMQQLLALRSQCDPQSLQLLDAWLDREHSEWRQQGGSDGPHQTPPPSSGAMDRAEALAILGLEEGASADDIKAAHRRLMQRLHPDRGGSTYLASRINEAKRLLMPEKDGRG